MANKDKTIEKQEVIIRQLASELLTQYFKAVEKQHIQDPAAPDWLLSKRYWKNVKQDTFDLLQEAGINAEELMGFVREDNKHSRDYGYPPYDPEDEE